MLRLLYIGIKKDNEPFRVVNRKLLDQELSSLPEGRYSLIIEKKRKPKSNPQLAWLYGQIYPHVLKGLIDAGWEDITNIDQTDAYCKSLFANTEIVNRHTGEAMTVPALKRDMTTTEFSTYVEAIRQWAAEFLNVNIPDPGEQLELI